ncbi:MAG: sugar phosphate isomerase/epimerase [Bryobacteraceae bacterium]
MAHCYTRRSVLAALTAASLSASERRPIRFGGPIFLKSDDPGALAREHRRLGYSAAFCPGVKLQETEKIRAIEKEFAAQNVAIAEVGAWNNMLDPDPAKREANLKYVTERLALADQVGARCAVNIAGSYNPTIWYGPHKKNFSREFFDATVQNVRRVLDSVKPKRTRFALEMMGWALPAGPDEYLDLIKAVGRKGFGVHLDVCNGINSPARFYASTAFIQECFRKLGPHIVSCHAKDLEWVVELNVHFKEVIPGRGELDYRAYLLGMASLPNDAPLMMEHLKGAAEYDEARNYIFKVGRELGLAFA